MLKQRGSSTLGGREVWFDRDVLRLNYDGRGEALGEFRSDDRILVVLQSGEFYTTGFDLSNHYEDNILLIERYDARKTWTAVYFDADQGYVYLKRFPSEDSEKRQNLMGDNPRHRLFLLTDEAYPRIEVTFGGHDSYRDPLVIEAAEFVGVKSVKARGKRVTTFTVASVDELEPTRHAPSPSSDGEPSATDVPSEEDEDGQMSLFEE